MVIHWIQIYIYNIYYILYIIQILLTIKRLFKSGAGFQTRTLHDRSETTNKTKIKQRKRKKKWG